MMRMSLYTFFILLLTTNGYAQTWSVKAGESIKEAMGDSIIFRYPQFKPGTVYFKTGTASTASLNLNLVNGEMEFLNGAGDTMTVDYESEIQYVVIHTDTFYYDKVYVELVHGNGTAKLAKVVAIVPVDAQKVGGYDQASSTSAINTAGYFFNGNQYSRITANKVMVLHKKTTWFIGDKFNHFLPAAKKNVYKMFAKQQPQIESFVKENKPVFTREEDLVTIIDLLGKE
jgi:hypothetical protein